MEQSVRHQQHAQQEATIHGSQFHISSHNNAQKTETERIQADLEDSSPIRLYSRDGVAGFGWCCGIYENGGKEIRGWAVDLTLTLTLAVDGREVFQVLAMKTHALVYSPASD